MNRFTVTTSTSWGGRIASALVGLIIGPILVIGAIVLIAWNENRAVTTERSLQEGRGAVVDVAPAPVIAANDGRLVHVTGAASAAGTLTDPMFGASAEQALSLRRDVEMFQWKETKKSQTRDKLGGGQETVTEYSYGTEWSAAAQDSSRFQFPDGHENPPMPFEAHTVLAKDARLGDFTVPDWILGRITATEAIPAQRLAVPADLHPPMRAQGDWLVSGDGGNPKVGDVRVRFREAPGQTVSVVAQQTGRSLERYQTHAGDRIGLVERGDHPAEQMFETALEENALMTWILRGVGVVVMLFGFLLLLGPLRAFAMVVPMLGNLVGGASFVVALLLALVLGLLVIGISWIAVRPLVGLPILGLAVLGLVLLWRAGRKRVAGPSPAPAMAGGPPPPPPPR